MANSVDPDKTVYYKLSHLDLHCLQRYLSIMKTCLYNFDPLKPHFYKVNWGSQGYSLIFLFLLKNIDCGYSLELPIRAGASKFSGSNEYPQSMS